MSELLPFAEEGPVAAAAETGITRGEQLLRWFNAEGEARLVEMAAGLPTGSRSWSFFGELELDGKPASAMGCLQTTALPTVESRSELQASLRRWFASDFLKKCHWTRSDGLPGGFLFTPVLVRDLGAGQTRRISADASILLAQIGSTYEWAAFRLDVLDYLKAFPMFAPFERWLRPFLHETGYMVFHPAFFCSSRPVPEGYKLEMCFGYSVAPWIVTPTFVACGAGRFHAAIKQYRIFQRPDDSLLIEIIFVVSGRISKVLDFGGWDPISGSVRFLDALTLHKTGISRRAQDWIDRFALIRHARIHCNLLEGMRAVWKNSVSGIRLRI